MPRCGTHNIVHPHIHCEVSHESREFIILRAQELGMSVSQYVRYCIAREIGFPITTRTGVEYDANSQRT